MVTLDIGVKCYINNGICRSPIGCVATWRSLKAQRSPTCDRAWLINYTWVFRKEKSANLRTSTSTKSDQSLLTFTELMNTSISLVLVQEVSQYTPLFRIKSMKLVPLAPVRGIFDLIEKPAKWFKSSAFQLFTSWSKHYYFYFFTPESASKVAELLAAERSHHLFNLYGSGSTSFNSAHKHFVSNHHAYNLFDFRAKCFLGACKHSDAHQ